MRRSRAGTTGAFASSSPGWAIAVWRSRRSRWPAASPTCRAERRRELRRQAEDCGLTLFGLHWLLASTEGLHAHLARRPTVRQATADYLGELARCCADLGGDVLVFGSPAQRRVPAGKTRAAGCRLRRRYVPSRARPAIADAGVRLCLEPLAAARGRLHQHLRGGRRDPRPHRRSAFRSAPGCQGDVIGRDAGPRADPPPRAAARATSTPTTPTVAAPASAPSISCRSSGRCGNPAITDGFRSRCSTTRPTRRRSRGRACGTCGNAKLWRAGSRKRRITHTRGATRPRSPN